VEAAPPLPEWDREREGRWLALFEPHILAVCTLHETYPGHHAHELHLRQAPSRVARALWSEILGEGWAHYCEEAAFDAGFRDGDPEAEVAMRTDALVRAARLLCAVGMPTQGMTLEEATAEFESTAGLDPDHARLEAVRGTWDPGYFGYTLGKLEILALRDRVGGDGAPSTTGCWPPAPRRQPSWRASYWPAALSGRPRTARSGRPRPTPPRTAGRSRTARGASRSSAGSWSSCGTGPCSLPPRSSATVALLHSPARAVPDPLL